MKICGALKGEIVISQTEVELYHKGLSKFDLYFKFDKYGQLEPEAFNLVPVPQKLEMAKPPKHWAEMALEERDKVIQKQNEIILKYSEMIDLVFKPRLVEE